MNDYDRTDAFPIYKIFELRNEAIICAVQIAKAVGTFGVFAFFQILLLFSRRWSLSCSCASCVSTRSFSARNCSRGFCFAISRDLLFLKMGIKKTAGLHMGMCVNGQFFDIQLLCSAQQT